MSENKIKGRVTCNKLADWCNKEFSRLEIEGVTISKVKPTRFSSDQYQGGARYLSIHFFYNSSPSIKGDFSCFYPIHYLQKSIDSGKSMQLTWPLSK